jgi:hypothetical protein
MHQYTEADLNLWNSQVARIAQRHFEENERPVEATRESCRRAVASSARRVVEASPSSSSVPRAAAPPVRPTLTAQEWQQRIQAIVNSPLASGGYERLALTLCEDTSLSIEQALGALKASHQDDVDEVNGRATQDKIIALHRGAAAPTKAAQPTTPAAAPSQATTTNVRADGGDMDEAAGRVMQDRVIAVFKNAGKRSA